MTNYKVYISGGITGRDIDAVKKEFDSAAEMWESFGIEAVNPTRNGLPSTATWDEHMVVDIEMLMTCQAIHMLPGWELSKGARIEYNIACELGLAVYPSNGVVNPKAFEYINGIVGREQIAQVLHVVQAISRVCDVTFTDFQGNQRNRLMFYARMMFSYELRKFMKMERISKLLNVKITSVRHFLRKCNEETRFNPEFQRMASAVAKMINKQN